MLESLIPAEAPRWYGPSVTPEEAAASVERAVEFKWDAYRAHKTVRDQAIAALTDQGLSVRDVAEVLGISKSLVAKRLKQKYFENPNDSEYEWADKYSERHTRTRDLVERAWNGLWRPDRDPDYGTGERDAGAASQ